MSVAAWFRERSSCPATSRSSRDASSGAANRSTRSTRAGERSVTCRRLRFPVFAQENDAQQHGSDGHATVGNVERPVANGAQSDVDEVDHAVGGANAIDQVAGGAAPGQAEGENLESL